MGSRVTPVGRFRSAQAQREGGDGALRAEPNVASAWCGDRAEKQVESTVQVGPCSRANGLVAKAARRVSRVCSHSSEAVTKGTLGRCGCAKRYLSTQMRHTKTKTKDRKWSTSTIVFGRAVLQRRGPLTSPMTSAAAPAVPGCRRPQRVLWAFLRVDRRTAAWIVTRCRFAADFRPSQTQSTHRGKGNRKDRKLASCSRNYNDCNTVSNAAHPLLCLRRQYQRSLLWTAASERALDQGKSSRLAEAWVLARDLAENKGARSPWLCMLRSTHICT
jgi:hypothetical protein